MNQNPGVNKFINIICLALHHPCDFAGVDFLLTHIRSILHSSRNQSLDLQCKSIDKFLYECDIDLVFINCVL